MRNSGRERLARRTRVATLGDGQGSTEGKVLPSIVAEQMSQGLGHSFADVRVHDDARGDVVARAFEARALAVGGELFFREGSYAPETAAGARVLAHELAHVVQQRPADGMGRGRADALRLPNDGWDTTSVGGAWTVDGARSVAEQEAHAAADAVAAGETADVGVGTVSAGTVQRWPWDDDAGGSGGMLGTLAGVVSGGGGGLDNPFGGGGLRSASDDPGAIPGQILSGGRDLLSNLLPSPSGVARQVGDITKRVQKGTESVIDPIVGGVAGASRWMGERVDDAEQWGEKSVGGTVDWGMHKASDIGGSLLGWGESVGGRVADVWGGMGEGMRRHEESELEH